jgi:DNA-binding transcriptional LysR family regulator
VVGDIVAYEGVVTGRVMVGGLSEAVPEFDVVHEQLFEDQLVVVARSSHPLLDTGNLSLSDLSQASGFFHVRLRRAEHGSTTLWRQPICRLVELPVALHATALPIGLRTLASSSPSASARALMNQFRRVGQELLNLM